MAALACILHDEHEEVTGSDIEKYIFTQDELAKRDIPFTGFDPANIKDGDTVIIGLSFDESHPEVKAAVDNPAVKTYYYNEYLGELLKRYTSICVAGTHGKSTTTGLLASVLERDAPTAYLIGDGHGFMPENASRFILESCEFKRHFLAYRPDYAILLNIELDHMDYYKDMDDYLDAFQTFADQVKDTVVYFGDDEHLGNLNYKTKAVSFGMDESNDFIAKDIVQSEAGMEYDVYHKGKKLIRIKLAEVGMPFLWDSLGTFALAFTLGMEPEEIEKGLQAYKGINRRFVIEEAGDSVLIDDYAHHPTAISLMIDAARKKYPDKKIIALYKPDRYSRLQFFLDRFAKSLNEADQSYVLDFPANAKPEDETITVTIQDLLDRLDNGSIIDISKKSAELLKDQGPAVYLFMSSKDIYLLKDLLKEQLS